MLKPGSIINEKYVVTSVFKHGGMSVVYRAFHKELNVPLVIKDVERGGKTGVLENSLVAEGGFLKTLQNEHLPRIYEVLEDSTRIMLIMDYIEGESLESILERLGSVAPEAVTDWSIQICDLYRYLHTQIPPIIYRDMKPANVILKPDGNIVVIDFGTARTWKNTGGLDSDTTCLGTEGFAAPEQFGGYGQSDARTDIYCLGATMFNLLTGHSPYLPPYGITPLGRWKSELQDSPLDDIVQKCCAKDPYERFQTASDLKDALIAACDGGKSGYVGFFRKKPKKEPELPDAQQSTGGAQQSSDGWQQSYKQVVEGDVASGILGKHARPAAASNTAAAAAAEQHSAPVSSTPASAPAPGTSGSRGSATKKTSKASAANAAGGAQAAGFVPDGSAGSPEAYPPLAEPAVSPYPADLSQGSEEIDSPWRTAFMVAVAVAAICLVILLASVLLGSLAVSVAALVAALIAVIVAVVCVVKG